jgi:hypothetical protein
MDILLDPISMIRYGSSSRSNPSVSIFQGLNLNPGVMFAPTWSTGEVRSASLFDKS